MFTGIVRHVGVVRSARPAAAGRRLVVDVGPLAAGLHLGDSVAVNGTCLTAAEIVGQSAAFDVVAETLSRTTLGDLAAGGRVNLEPALQLEQGLDGHLVQGHVDGVAVVRAIRKDAAGHVVEFSSSDDLTDGMVPKGSVAIDGVSLTLVDVHKDGFSVALIPTTLAETTLGEMRPGGRVNIEIDLIGKYVRTCLRQMLSGSGGHGAPDGLTMEKLRQAGFVEDGGAG